jgi:3-oxoacyl-[acyl-carrier protein] reductase
MLMKESRRAHVQRLAAMTTLGRIGETSEVANVCLFLASDMSSYLNGASIDVNGGLAF